MVTFRRHIPSDKQWYYIDGSKNILFGSLIVHYDTRAAKVNFYHRVFLVKNNLEPYFSQGV